MLENSEGCTGTETAIEGSREMPSELSEHYIFRVASIALPAVKGTPRRKHHRRLS